MRVGFVHVLQISVHVIFILTVSSNLLNCMKLVT